MIVRFFILTLLLHLSTEGEGQIIDSALKQYAQQLSAEKVYVHFDNNAYIPGQTIFFKAYLFSGLDPSDISKTLYVKWTDEAGNQTITTSPVTDASASGSYTIPSTFSNCSIEVTAFTKWMLNDTSFLFHKRIVIIQPQKSNTSVIPISKSVSIDFLPEGGDLVEGITSEVAFKAINSKGLPETVSGLIKNNFGVTVATFKSVHKGMGKFSFKPLPGELYSAEWYAINEQVTYSKKLPRAKPSGVVLHVGLQSGQRTFMLQRSSEKASAMNYKLYAHIHGHVLYKATINLNIATIVSGILPVEQFPSGVVQLTLFNNENKPLAERIIFVDNNEYRSPTLLKFDTLNLGKRCKNVINIELPDSVSSNFSVAVMDASIKENADDNIFSQFLLSSELKGVVYQAAAYFSTNNDSLAYWLDLIMTTNGWRRFKWDEVLKMPPAPRFTADTNYITLAGRVNGLTKSQIRKAGVISFFIEPKNQIWQNKFTPLETDGSFRETNLLFYDTAKVYYSVNQLLPAKDVITLNKDLLPHTFLHTTAYQNQPEVIDSGILNNEVFKAQYKSLEDTSSVKLMEEVIVKSKTKMQVIEDYYVQDKWLKGTYGIGFDLTKDSVKGKGRTLGEYLKQHTDYIASNKEAIYFFNDFESEKENVYNMLLTDVAYVKVIPSTTRNGKGKIAIYTKKEKNIKGLSYFLMPGYSVEKEFYQPVYSTIDTSFQDTRSTLLWVPYIITNGSNKSIKLTFFNNDISKELRLVIEGITNDGKLIYYTTVVR